jgi:hypothetical protein
MLHSQIDNEEIIERYIRNQLAPEQRQAFEEHFLACEECFESLQTTERFIAGVRDASARGLLHDQAGRASTTHSGAWFRWAFVASACAALTLAALAGWMYLFQIPALKQELTESAAALQSERESRAELEHKSISVEQPEANIPLVMLQASRAANDEPADVLVPPEAKHVVLWIEIGTSRYHDFRLEVFSQDARLVTSVDHLEMGPYGALAASIPADKLPAGDFRIKLSAKNPPLLAGEYRLRIRRP